MFQWLSKFTASGNRLSKATAALADTFEQLNALVREQTGLDKLDGKTARPARVTRKGKAEVLDHKPAEADTDAA
jgi:hypothetical protein